ncbi:MAG: hypothetical protein V1753_07830 [Pseudomonadota bacterium]
MSDFFKKIRKNIKIRGALVSVTLAICVLIALSINGLKTGQVTEEGLKQEAKHLPDIDRSRPTSIRLSEERLLTERSNSNIRGFAPLTIPQKKQTSLALIIKKSKLTPKKGDNTHPKGGRVSLAQQAVYLTTNAVADALGRVTATESDRKSGEPRIIVAEIASAQYEQLHDELSKIGVIEESLSSPDLMPNDILEVKIELIITK